ncbi:MAG: hypothetical protein BLITH_1366 [Brockia lithotrophica]|uniref:Uncharacterized protein n=1 Tax=Brockia lithotrophica TaxID=933949 RepID=A0A2T5G6D0_9BACL|nr:MAG: hypothetical protein BLITH_1366 [Brockia lithotrophica]
MNWWLIGRLRLLEIRRSLMASVWDAPWVGIVVLLALLGLSLVDVALFQTFSAAPTQALDFWILYFVRILIVGTVLASLLVDARRLIPNGFPQALPVTDGALLFGSTAPLFLATGIFFLLLTAPVLLALAQRGYLSLPGMAVGGVGVVILMTSTAWLTLVGKLAAGRVWVLFGGAIGAILWFLTGTAWLDVFRPGPHLTGGIVMLLILDWLAWRWLLSRFSWPMGGGVRTRVDKPPLGHRWPFPYGRWAWLGYEFRNVLRDTNTKIILAIATGGIWLFLGLLVWRPWAGEGLAPFPYERGLLYVQPGLYLGAFSLALMVLRARGIDLPLETWIRSLPLRPADYILAKAVGTIALASMAWVILFIGVGFLIGLNVEILVLNLGPATLFALVTYSLALAWGVAVPVRDEDTLQGFMHVVLFALASVVLYRVAQLLESLFPRPVGFVMSSLGFISLGIGLAIIAEKWRRRDGP